MNDILFYFFSAILGLCSLGTLFFQDSIRCTASAGLAVGAVAALMALEGAVVFSALFLLVFAGSILLFHLMTGILLNIHPDEQGTRRLTFQAIIVTCFLTYLASAFLGLLHQSDPGDSNALGTENHLAVGTILFEDYGFVLCLTALVFLSAMIGVFIIARRRI
jgi:NADH:ubiquinone oxidoreductase subunit 6 (subunit J)